MTSAYVRPYGLSGSGKLKWIPPLSHREFCRLLFQKALEVIANQNLSTEQIFGVF